MEIKKIEAHYGLNFLLGVVLIALPFVLGNVPYLNLLFLGVEQKIAYFWIAALIVFRPQTKKVGFFLISLLIIHFFLINFYNDYGSAVLGMILYISLIYFYFQLVKKL